MKVTPLAIVIIAGLLIVAGSAYLNKVVFADDSWSSIVQRQQASIEKASMVYDNKYQFNNVPQSTRNWTGLGFVTTDSSTTGRDIPAQSQMSMENALATFDQIHAQLLNYTQGNGYSGLTSVTTDESGRNRNTMIAQGMDQIDQQVAGLISQLGQISQAYASMGPVATTTGYWSNVQGNIDSTSIAQEAQASDLIKQIWQIDQQYMNLQSGGTTNSVTQGRQIAAAQLSSLEKAIQTFNIIHAHLLQRSYGSQYAGLSSTSTDEQIPGQGYRTYGDRHSSIDFATQMALQNAINFYNSYYPETPLSVPNYSH
ncbi:MAG TPA: hypothetical protein VEJ68_01740 [Candidatus Bathyarchaeia archaeon]|nr:hypothetical protein [Candidatus Bathyarchaeia archaeon]